MQRIICGISQFSNERQKSINAGKSKINSHSWNIFADQLKKYKSLRNNYSWILNSFLNHSCIFVKLKNSRKLNLSYYSRGREVWGPHVDILKCCKSLVYEWKLLPLLYPCLMALFTSYTINIMGDICVQATELISLAKAEH